MLTLTEEADGEAAEVDTEKKVVAGTSRLLIVTAGVGTRSALPVWVDDGVALALASLDGSADPDTEAVGVADESADEETASVGEEEEESVVGSVGSGRSLQPLSSSLSSSPSSSSSLSSPEGHWSSPESVAAGSSEVAVEVGVSVEVSVSDESVSDGSVSDGSVSVSVSDGSVSVSDGSSSEESSGGEPDASGGAAEVVFELPPAAVKRLFPSS